MRFAVNLASAPLCGADPTALRRLRQIGPALPCVNPGGVVVLDPDGVERVLREPSRFSSLAMTGADSYLLGADGAEHRVARRILVRTIRQITDDPAFASALATTAEASLGRLVEVGGGDAVAELATPLAIEGAVRVSGLDREHVTQICSWADAVVRHATGRPTQLSSAQVRDASSATTDLILAQLRCRLASTARPSGRAAGSSAAGTTPSLLDTTAEAVRAGELPEEGALSVVLLMLLGALDTTAALVSRCLATIVENGADGRCLAPAGLVEGVLAQRCPVRYVRRTAVSATRFGDFELAPGTAVLAHLRSASDERVRVSGLASAHLAFGAGPHACPGAGVARLTARACVAEAQRRLADIALLSAGAGISSDSSQIDGLAALPLAVVGRGRR